MANHPVHGRIDGPIVMIGFGSIGRGTLPLIERHFEFDKSRFVVIDPEDKDRKLLDERGIRFIQDGVTRQNYRKLLTPLLTAGGGQGFCVNLSVDTSSLDIMDLCSEIGALYIDTVNEPWPGFYFDSKLGPEARSNYALREATMKAKRARKPGSTTAVSCCGANPGMVSWFVKQALLNVASDTKLKFKEPAEPRGLGPACQEARRQGHPYRRARHPARQAAQADGGVRQHLVGRGLRVGGPAARRARLGHAREVDAGERPQAQDRLPGGDLPDAAGREHARALVDADRQGPVRLPGDAQRVRSRSPTTSRCARARRRSTGRPATTPITPATTRCCRCTRCSAAPGERQERIHILDEHEIVDGIDELGVLLYGHKKNAYWYGSQLSIEETRADRALPERHRPAGDLRGAGRHGLGAGESGRPASSRPTRWISGAAWRCRCRISAR